MFFLSCFSPVSLLFLCTACIENVIDSRGREEQNEPQSLYSLIGGTKTPDTQEDSLTMVSRTQSNVDNLMMGRVVRKDSMFVLSIKREDAVFLGVPNEVYDEYLDYVMKLNEQ